MLIQKRSPVAVVSALFILAMLVIGAACESTYQVETSQGTSEIAYRYDRKHDLCFAMIASATHSGWRVVSISYVPLAEINCR